MFKSLLNEIEKHRYSEKIFWGFFIKVKDFVWSIKYSFKYYFNKPWPAVAPNFIIIGAMKSGTTTLYNYLKKHPDIFMSNIKEPGLFLDNEKKVHRHSLKIFNAEIKHRLFNWQLRRVMFFGYKSEKLTGEASTYYAQAPYQGRGVAHNIYKYYPGMKLIYIIRNPLDRIISQYLHSLRFCPAKLKYHDLNLLIKDDPGLFLNLSRYYYQLSNYLKYFPKENFKVIIFEELISQPQKIFKEVFDFLGARTSIDVVGSKLYAYNKSENRDKSFKFSQENYNYLINDLQEDIKELEKFLGRKLDIWDLSKDRWRH